MNPPRTCTAVAAIALVSALPCHARQITFSQHEASAWVRANVFDGGPVVSDAGELEDPLLDEFNVVAYDLTRAGSFGATAIAFADSEIVSLLDGGMRVLVEFGALYDPSDFASGDRPGGMAEGALHSVIEFRMPADEIFWAYRLLIDDTARFDGLTAIAIENVTQNKSILTLTEEVFPIETTLRGNAGDIIRITSDMEGSGSVPAGFSASYQYGGDLAMTFRIPEPSTLPFLLVATALFPRGRSRAVY